MNETLPQRQQRQKQEWYQRNRLNQIKDVKQKRQTKLAFLRDLKSRLSCIKCGENHPSALDFHHRDPSTRKFRISQAQNYGMLAILQEMKKCDVLCANCHRKYHHP